MRFFSSNLCSPLLLLTLAASTHATTDPHHHLRKTAAAASAVDALTAEFPNPVNTWKDEKTGTFYSQNQVFLKNTDASR